MVGPSDVMVFMDLFSALFLLFTLIWVVFFVFGILLSLFCFGFWVWMLVDCIKREEFHSFKENAQLIWILILLFTGVIGALIYYFVEKRASRSEVVK